MQQSRAKQDIAQYNTRQNNARRTHRDLQQALAPQTEQNGLVNFEFNIKHKKQEKHQRTAFTTEAPEHPEYLCTNSSI